MNTVHVLLVYSLNEHRLISERHFNDGREAHSAYVEAERDHFLDTSLEIVLLASDSIETIRHTHASYFSDGTEIAALNLKGLLPA